MSRRALALFAAGAVVAGGLAYYGSVLSGALANFGLLASSLQRDVQSPAREEPEGELDDAEPGAAAAPATARNATLDAIDSLDAARAARSVEDALEALRALEAELGMNDRNDALLVIERGAPTFGSGAAPPLSPLARQVQAARAGDEVAIATIVAALENRDPAVSRAAWSALSGLAYSNHLAKFEALLADSDPAVRERATQVLRELPYD